MQKQALISVSNKDGVVQLARELEKMGYSIVSTGGTAKTLTDNKVKNKNITDITGFTECLDGRVKTLHPNVHAGLLAKRDNAEHMAQLASLKVNPIDVVVVNLYPFKETIQKPNVQLDEVIENIDIGGPTMLRSAAKNFNDVLVLVDPSDYSEAIDRLKNGTCDYDYRFRLMYKVFAHTANYDSLISEYMCAKLNIEYPETLTTSYSKLYDLRYGENPHQSAAFYSDALVKPYSIAAAQKLNGKELSYNNINDANGAISILSEFTAPTAVAVKHSNPCGVCSAKTIHEAYLGALNSDPISIFGGIIALNKKVDIATAAELIKIFLEIVIAPDFDDDALKLLCTKPNLRVLKLPAISNAGKNAELSVSRELRHINGGILVQQSDCILYNKNDIEVVTKAQITDKDLLELDFAYKVVKHTKSNAIVVSKKQATLGIGGGQTNRIWATKQALQNADVKAKGAYLASDAFFPFSDCVEECVKAGIKAIIQPGGSKNDQDSIDVCNEHGIAMVFVKNRHFKH